MPQAPHSVPSPNAPDNSAHENVFDTDGADPEKHPLPARTPFFSRRNLLGPVVKDHGDIPLLACSFATGLVDGACFRNWGMFVGMQTGNTVILGLSTAGLPSNPYAWLTTLVSIVTFLVGAFITFRLSKFIAPDGPTRNRLWASGLFGIQAILILLSAALATPEQLIPQMPSPIGRYELEPEWILHNIKIVSLIPPLAFQSGMQIAASRLLGFNEVPVNVITSTYCDLMGDYKLFAANNVRRNRRALSVILLLIGAIIAGWLIRSDGGLESVLWLAGGVKAVTAITYFSMIPAVKEDLAK